MERSDDQKYTSILMLKLIIKSKWTSKMTWNLKPSTMPQYPIDTAKAHMSCVLCLLPYLNTGGLMEMHLFRKFRRWPQSQASKDVFLIKAKHRPERYCKIYDFTDRENTLSHFDCLIAGDSEPFQLSGDKVSLDRKAPGMSLTCCRCFVKVGSHFLTLSLM